MLPLPLLLIIDIDLSPDYSTRKSRRDILTRILNGPKELVHCKKLGAMETTPVTRKERCANIYVPWAELS